MSMRSRSKGRINWDFTRSQLVQQHFRVGIYAGLVIDIFFYSRIEGWPRWAMGAALPIALGLLMGFTGGDGYDVAKKKFQQTEN